MKKAIIIVCLVSCISAGSELFRIAELPLMDYHANGICVDGDYAYIVGGSSIEDCDSILKVVDISNPYLPVLISSGDTVNYGRGYDVTVRNGIAYIAYSGTESEQNGLQIFDVSDPYEPKPMSVLGTDTLVHSLYLEKNIVYIANCSYGVVMVDVSNPYEPEVISRYVYENGTQVEDVYINYPLLYMCTLADEFIIANVSNPTEPELVSYYDEIDCNHDVVIEMPHAYLSSLGGYITVLDITDPYSPLFVSSSYTSRGDFFRKDVFNGYLFMAALRRLYAFDISNPVGMEQLAFTPAYICTDVDYQDGYIYTCGQNLKVFLLQETDIDEDHSAIPYVNHLGNNYPNPFNNTTMISYQLSQSCYVKLQVYDLLGNLIAHLVNSVQQPGNYTVKFDTQNLPSGIYFYKLNAGDFTDTKKMLLVK